LLKSAAGYTIPGSNDPLQMLAAFALSTDKHQKAPKRPLQEDLGLLHHMHLISPEMKASCSIKHKALQKEEE